MLPPPWNTRPTPPGESQADGVRFYRKRETVWDPVVSLLDPDPRRLTVGSDETERLRGQDRDT